MSSLLEKASLVMIPSGYKEGVVYSEIPIDGSADLVFTRASDGTRVNSSGLVENVPWNLFQYSNDFSNVAWTKYNATLTSGQSDPFGGTNAWKFEAIISAQADFRQTVTGANSYSFYAKAGTSPEFRLWSGTSGTIFNLSTGTISSGSGIIESVGNGWYRCTILTSTSASVTLIPYFVGNAGDYIYVAFGQAQTTTTAKPYFPTTDRQNVPRLTYEGGCPSLLLEPQRTNLILQSEAFGSASWSAFNASVSSNVSATLDPQGYYGADKLVEDSSSAYHDADQVQTYTAAAYTISVFAKAAGRNHIFLQHFDGITFFTSGTFNLADGTISGVGSIENYGNGWYRCSYTATTASGTGKSYINLSNGTTGNYQGDGTSGVYIWGAQLEAGSYPTSYIPTTSAAVTRVADECYKTGISSLIGQTEGTIFADITRITSTANDAFWISISDGTTNDWLFMGTEATGGRFYVRVSNSVKVDEYPSFSIGRHKLALGYKSGEVVGYMDGVQLFTSTNTFSITSLTKISIGPSSASSSPVNTPGEVNQAVLFKTRLTNAELAAITSL